MMTSLTESFPSYGLEQEVKYLTDAGVISHLLSDISDARPFVHAPILRDERTNVYFDTAKSFQLFRRGFEVRGRAHDKKAGKYKYDLKCAHPIGDQSHGLDEHGIFTRREYREVSSKTSPALKWFSRNGMKDVLADVEKKNLVPWVQGDFVRRRVTFSPTPGTELEMAFETGHYRTMDDEHRSDKMFIVELELKHGDYQVLVDTHKMLQEKYGLEPCFKTKGEMGMEFVGSTLEGKQLERFQEAKAHRAPPAYPSIPFSEFKARPAL